MVSCGVIIVEKKTMLSKYYDLHGWPDKAANVSTSEKAESRYSG